MQANHVVVTEILTGIQVAVRAAGSQEALAKVLGVTQQAIGHWVKQGYVPTRRVVEVETLYGVPRAKLIDPRIADLVDMLPPQVADK